MHAYKLHITGIVRLLCLGLLLGAVEARAQAPSYRVVAKIEAAATGLGNFTGRLAIKNWQANARGERCLALPYNDSNYEFDPGRSFDLLPQKYVKPQRLHGHLSVQSLTPGIEVEFIQPYLVRLRAADRVVSPESLAAGLSLKFSGAVPRWPDADPDEWFFADFYPQPLENCPLSVEKPLTFSPVPVADITATIEVPKGWTIAAPGSLDKGDKRRRFRGSKLTFAVAKDYKHARFDVGGTGVEVYFRTESFRGLLPTIQAALREHARLLGPLPFPGLVVVETAELEKSALPGVIALNRPRQAALNAVQQDVLNWSRWQLTSFIAEQWFGAAMTVGIDDLWFLRGWIDFTTSVSLRAMPSLQDLFATQNGLPPALTFTYQQNQDLVAAALTYFQPYNRLMNEQRVSSQEFASQHSLIYIRHALGLRHLYWSLGEDKSRELIAAFNARYQFQRVKPRDFLDFVAAYAPDRRDIVDVLTHWWMTDDWPDFYLDGIEEDIDPDSDGYKVALTVGHEGDFAFPVEVRATERDGTVQTAVTQLDDEGDWVAHFRTKERVREVAIDPDRHVFDWDRFDNTTSWPAINFIPGGARTFADDAYTVFWLPLASQLPGEPLTLLLASQSFKYIHSGLTSILAYVPSERRLGLSTNYLTDFPRLGSYAILGLTQDKGNSFKGERLVEAGLYKMPFLIEDPSLEVGVRLRNRQVLGQPDTVHQTVALKTMLLPINNYGACSYSLKTEFEAVPGVSRGRVRYGRHNGLGDGACRLKFLPAEPDLGFRAFSGIVTKAGDVPENVYYNPQDLKEARIRIDAPQLPQAARISSAGADLLFPITLPLPDDIFALKREARWRLFYDYGRAVPKDDPVEVTYRDAGVGLFVPFGGDLVGKGSVSILNFSALVVLYKDIAGERSMKPGFLFDFDFFGKL